MSELPGEFFSRDDLGLVEPKSISTNIDPKNGGVGVHWGASAPPSSVDEAKGLWRRWQQGHMAPGGLGVANGGADIAYNLGYDDWGNLYAGRGLGIRSGANGTSLANLRFYAFAYIGGPKSEPTPLAFGALNYAIEIARAMGDAALGVKPHSLWRPTACPGDGWREYIIGADGKATLPNIPELETDENEQTEDGGDEKGYITRDSRGPHVRDWQRLCERILPNHRDAHKPDGIFGPMTVRWTIAVYAVIGLTARDPSRPRVGQRSISTAEEYLSRPRFTFKHTVLLRHGNVGPAVSEWQRACSFVLPNDRDRHRADGWWGPKTNRWTGRVMTRLGLVPRPPTNPIVGPRTRGAVEGHRP